MHDDDQFPDGNMEFYAERIRQNEQVLTEAAMELEFSQCLAELHESIPWKKLIERIRTVESNETFKLRSKEMTPYHLGKIQGRLSAFALLTNPVPLDSSGIDDIRKRITLARNQIEADRRLVEN